MRGQFRVFAGMLVVTILSAALAGWLGVRFGTRQTQEPDLDTVLHHRLELTSAQEVKIDVLETGFAARRRALQAEMRVANRDLANAITQEHAYGPDTQRAIDRFHRAMATLQQESVRHVLAMRAVLTPEQAHEFDAIIAKSLTDDRP